MTVNPPRTMMRRALAEAAATFFDVVDQFGKNAGGGVFFIEGAGKAQDVIEHLPAQAIDHPAGDIFRAIAAQDSADSPGDEYTDDQGGQFDTPVGEPTLNAVHEFLHPPGKR